MTTKDHFTALMRERRKFKRGDPDYEWRTRAARQLFWLMIGKPVIEWGAK